MTALLDISRLSIRFPGRANPTVENVGFTLARGGILALVGESGSGKSLIAHSIAGILTKSARIEATTLALDGIDLRIPANVAPLRGRRIGMVFQNARAALNPTVSVGRQISDVIRRHRGLRGRALAAATLEALAAVLIPDPARRAYPHELSGGMCQRIMLAIALAGEPDLLIADEPTTGLDATTQAAILDLMTDRARSRGMATLLITHDLGLARQYADRVLVLHAGQVAEEAGAEDIFRRPRHPYTARLLGAVPAYAAHVGALNGIPGKFPDLAAPTLPACRFAERCDRAAEICRQETPLPAPLAPEHRVACWRPLP